MQYFTEAEPVRVLAESVFTGSAKETDADTVAITIKFSDGSIGTVHYLAVGDKSFPKERLEIFGDGAVGVLDDFKTATLTHNGQTRKLGSGTQDKGHREEVQEFARNLLAKPGAPISFRSLVATTLATFAALESLRSGQPALVDTEAVLQEGCAPNLEP
jgi:polar amino acid transport system substrate-binding protein